MRAAGLAMALCLMTSGVSLGAVTIPPDGSGSVQAQTGGSPSRLPALTAEFSTEEGSNEYLNGPEYSGSGADSSSPDKIRRSSSLRCHP